MLHAHILYCTHFTRHFRLLVKVCVQNSLKKISFRNQTWTLCIVDMHDMVLRVPSQGLRVHACLWTCVLQLDPYWSLLYKYKLTKTSVTKNMILRRNPTQRWSIPLKTNARTYDLLHVTHCNQKVHWRHSTFTETHEWDNIKYMSVC